jgi:DNA polymerase-3 subunit delta
MARRSSGVFASETLKTITRELQKGWPPGLTVLTGGDLYHLDRAQRALIEALLPDETSDFALTVFGEQRIDVSAVVAAVRSAGMFTERRVVLVRDVAALDGDGDALVAYGANPPGSSHLIIRAPALDKRRKLHQALLKGGRVFEFGAAGPQDAPRIAGEVAAMAVEKGFEIDREAAVMLAEVCGGDFYRIDTELAKIGAWCGTEDGSAVTPRVLREVAAGSAVLSGWEVASALLRRERGAAVAALHCLLEAGDEPLRLLGGLAYRARSILQARAMIERGAPATSAVRAARIWGENPSEAADGVSRYTMAEVLRFPALLLEADRTLKSRSLAPRAVLGSLLERMIADTGRQPRGQS